MSRRAASFRDLTSINPFADGAVPAMSRVRREEAKKVSSNRLTDPAGARRGLFTDGAHR